MSGPDTLPKSLAVGHRKYGEQKVAMRQKDLGIWRSYTWRDSYEQVRSLCLGLIQLGLQRGDKACIIGDNDRERILVVESAHAQVADLSDFESEGWTMQTVIHRQRTACSLGATGHR